MGLEPLRVRAGFAFILSVAFIKIPHSSTFPAQKSLNQGSLSWQQVHGALGLRAFSRPRVTLTQTTEDRYAPPGRSSGGGWRDRFKSRMSPGITVFLTRTSVLFRSQEAKAPAVFIMQTPAQVLSLAGTGRVEHFPW